MKPSTLRAVVVLLYAAFLLLPASCAPKESRFLALPPNPPLASEPQVSVLLEGSPEVMIPLGAKYTLTGENGAVLKSDTTPREAALGVDKGVITLGSMPLTSSKKVRLSANLPISVSGERVKASLLILPAADGFGVVITIPFEDYIAGVIEAELYKSWPLEVRKVQAIAARSFALVRMTRTPKSAQYQIRASELDQTFRFPAADSDSRKAADSTRGTILMYRGNILEALYCSSCGGKTAAAESVFETPPIAPLSSVSCLCASRWAEAKDLWRFEVEWPAFYKAALAESKDKPIPSPGRVELTRAPDGTVTAFIVKYPDGEITVSGKDLRERVGPRNLKSLWFDAVCREGKLTFIGRGFGHRVGLCQWGALEMAKSGEDYVSILAHYYPGAFPARLYK
ncbi:MAG: SpoIID/LytB domain-containing protein [Candidatus Brocadiia bacterium]